MKAKLLQEKAAIQKSEKTSKAVKHKIDDSTNLLSSKKAKTSNSKTVDSSNKSPLKLKSAKKEQSTVVYLGHVPNGFFEKQMYSFFSQFGKVEKVKHFRNPKTNQSRGYAFLKFETHEVALEVAATMNGYFLQDRQLKCELVPLDRQHEGMFLPPKKKIEPESLTVTKSDSNDIDIVDVEEEFHASKVTDEGKVERRLRSFAQKQNKKQLKLKALGIDFDISQVLNI